MSELQEIYLTEIIKILGWQGGTFEQVKAEIKRLVKKDELLKLISKTIIDENRKK